MYIELLLIISLLPVILIGSFIYKKDKNKEPHRLRPRGDAKRMARRYRKGFERPGGNFRHSDRGRRNSDVLRQLV